MKNLNKKEVRQITGGGLGDEVVGLLYFFVPALRLVDLSTNPDDQHPDPNAI